MKELEEDKDRLRVKNLIKLKDRTVLLELNEECDLKLVKERLDDSTKLASICPGKIKPRIIVYDVKRFIG